MDKILITGASGLIGSYLQKYLNKENFEVVTLSRSKKLADKNKFQWNLEKKFIEEGALDNIDYIIHLAGAGIADKRWTEERKKEIIDSRVASSDLIFEKINSSSAKPKAFISASAIGYYGAVTSDKIFSETDPPGEDFQAKVCEIWEKSTFKYSEAGIRTVQLRFGIVLSSEGGALKRMLLPAKLGIGSPLGSGKQYFPWIHLKDVANVIKKCLNDEKMTGPYNIVASQHVRFEDFSKTLATVLNRPIFAPNVPAFLLKIIFGEMSKIILEGSRISNQKLVAAGFKSEFSDLESALKNLLSKN